MRKENLLSAKVNFIIGVTFIGAVALFSIVTILKAGGNANPIEEAFIQRTQLGEDR